MVATGGRPWVSVPVLQKGAWKRHLIGLASGWFTLLLFTPLLFTLTGCNPTCRQVCRQLLDCEDPLFVTIDLETCADECADQELVYESIEDKTGDDAALERYRDHKACIWSSTCSEVQGGACYDSELFPY